MNEDKRPVAAGPMKTDDVKQQTWTFYYHKGPAPKYGKVEARDERTAMAVATRWCQFNGCKPPASVQLEILATEAILSQPDPTVPEELPGPIEATTGELVAK